MTYFCVVEEKKPLKEMQESLSKGLIKLVKSLNMKKFRDEYNLFMGEGPKVVDDLLRTFDCKVLIATASYLSSRRNVCAETVVKVSDADLKRVSLLKTPHEVVAVFRKPMNKPLPIEVNALCMGLDDVQDPGNVGTIVRLADWFGIEQIYASHHTADVFSPKVVQATMGALARVRVEYVDLPLFLSSLPSQLPIMGTFLEGNNVYESKLPANGILIMGNEGNGISEAVGKLVTQRLHIPNFPQGRQTSESLNVAIATAIVCSEFRRRIMKR